ncbi:MAG: phage protein U [Rickettsiales bacterium]|jgi:phage protein U
MKDYFKDISSKLNVNSLLGIDMMMILGDYRFAIKNSAYQTLKRQSEYKWQETSRIGNNPALQFTGFGVETIDLEGVIYPGFKGGLQQVSLMRAQAGRGVPLFLVSGTGSAFGRWCVVRISENQENFLKDGSPRKISFSITLKRYGEDQKQGIRGIIKNLINSII